MKGPSTSLQGENADVVIKVADNIKENRLYCLALGFLSMTFLFFANICLFWARVNNPIAIYLSLGYIIGYFVFVQQSYSCFALFHPDLNPHIAKIEGTL